MKKLLLLSLLGMSSQTMASEPWVQFGGAQRNWTVNSPTSIVLDRGESWSRPLGPGTSGIVHDGQRIFTMYSEPSVADRTKGDEVVLALDAKTGETQWTYRYPVAQHAKQEKYNNEPIQPQATPALAEGVLCTLGFTGIFTGFEAITGKMLWQHDLVKDFAATPVQFGFAASPLVHRGRLIVHVGGVTNLIAFAPKDGSVLWRSAAAEPSYASPVLLKVDDEEQIVQMTRDDIVGCAAEDGAERWRYALPKQGLTNVPTPLVLEEGRLLISGQGVSGTQMLKVTRQGRQFDVRVIWTNRRAEFFYCNWVSDGAAVYGGVGPLFGALSLEDGHELWRERGQAHANVLKLPTETLILRGDGRLTQCQLQPKGLQEGKQVPLLKDRCWTAPTVVGDMLYARNSNRLVAVNIRP